MKTNDSGPTWNIAALLSALFLLPAPLSAAHLPNRFLTPGRANPALQRQVLCASSFHTTPFRRVTLKMHRQVWAAYGMDWSKDHSCCEDDHLIPIELGGSNDNSNRWPEPWAEARLKDKLENRLRGLVCRDEVSLGTAQREISVDWVHAYKKYVGPLP